MKFWSRYSTKLRIMVSLGVFVTLAGIALGVFGVTRDHPHDVLALAADHINSVSSYRFNMIARQVEGNHVVSSQTNGTVQSGVGMWIVTRTDGGDYEETYVLDRKQLTRTSPDGKFVSHTSELKPADLDPLNIARELRSSSSLLNVHTAGEEVVDGHRTVHVTGKSNMAKKANEIFPDYNQMSDQEQAFRRDARNQMLSGTEVVDLWIDKDSGLVRRHHLKATFPHVGDAPAYSFSVTTTLSDFNHAAIHLPK